MTFLDKFSVESTQRQELQLKCKGIVARYEKNTYVSGRGWATSDKFNILKRQSCPGCEICLPLKDCIDEYVIDGGVIQFDSRKVSHGDAVNLRFRPESYEYVEGYYTGYVEEYSIWAEKVEK